MTVTFEHETLVEAPIELVFDLSLDVDVHTASMSSSHERAVGGVTSGRMELGDEVTWRARHFGVPFTMTSRITKLDRPHRFVDQQVKGPFRRFHHEHRFEETPDGTVMVDHLRFRAPLGRIGALVERSILDRYLWRLIETRSDYIKAEAERRAAPEP